MGRVRPEDWRPQGVEVLEPRAWEALRQAERSVLVTAGAGAGKTEFLAQKATYLLQTGLCPAPKRILSISFKRDAAYTLSERVAVRCPSEQARRFDSYTFDAFAKSLVDRFRAAIPDGYRPSRNYRTVTPRQGDYRQFLEAYGFHDVNVQQFERYLAEARLPIVNEGSQLQRAIATYWQVQYDGQDEILLTFSMINRLAELLIRENFFIQKALLETYPIVFLDEFQDTTLPQFEFLCTAFGGSKTIFTAVGDNKQRIMGWAGAMPNAFAEFEQRFAAQRISLICNWRSHADLVSIQHTIARLIDPNVEELEARADRLVDGDIAAIWQFDTEEEENNYIAQWVKLEVQKGHVEPHDIAILVRMHADNVANNLSPAFANQGLRLRNVARNVGEIAIQDLLSEDLTRILLQLLRLGASVRSPESWNAALLDLQYLEAVDPSDDVRQQILQRRLQTFVREMRHFLSALNPVPESAQQAVQKALDFIGIDVLRRAYPSYQRWSDFDRVWNGFTLLLQESLQHANTWLEALNEFEGIGQIPLMTIHKSKGMEFHTIIFYGLDDNTWWSLKPKKREELNSFFVAFTRAKQRAFFTLCSRRGQAIRWLEDFLLPSGVQKKIFRGDGHLKRPNEKL